jgi:hypothetical protein
VSWGRGIIGPCVCLWVLGLLGLRLTRLAWGWDGRVVRLLKDRHIPYTLGYDLSGTATWGPDRLRSSK